MPNHADPPISLEALLRKQEAAKASLIPIIVEGALCPKAEPVKEAQIHKLYTTSVGPKALHHLTQEDVLSTLSKCKGLTVACHCEDNDIIDAHKDEKSHIKRRPASAEERAIGYFSRGCRDYGVKGIVCHISSALGYAAVPEGIIKETAPHYLHFCVDDFENYPAYKEFGEQFFNVNPSLKHRYDKNVLLQYFRLGKFDIMGSDHAPHTKKQKGEGMSGFSGLDIMGVFAGHLINKGVNPSLIAKICSYNPAQLVGIKQGMITEGYIGSFTVINLKDSTNVTTDYLQTKNKENTPWLGETLSASVEATIVKGKVCKLNGELTV
jgi:dihydroorotase